MTYSVTVDTSALTEYAADWERLAAVAQPEFDRAMGEALAVLEGEIVGRTPVNTGFLRQSFGSTQRRTPMGIEGEVRSIATYAAPVEFGRLPGRMPPVDAIKYWVRRKLGITGDREARSAAYVIARAIGKRGTFADKNPRGAQMVEQGLQAATPYVEKLFGDAVGRIIKRLSE